jgi:alpha-galactosidase
MSLWRPFLSLQFAFLAAAVYATEYHVAIAGDDANKGSLPAPLRTISEAALRTPSNPFPGPFELRGDTNKALLLWTDQNAPAKPAKPDKAASQEEKVILTPEPPRVPRINGPKIFGVRPGSPVLFTIPATGDRPMRFSARNLPSGLKLEPETGQITGDLKDKGEYVVALRARNRRGTAERNFKFVCGDTLALTPHMGWNSWYIWKNQVSDTIVREAADAMVDSGLIQHGYAYVNIDDCWALKSATRVPPYRFSGEPRDGHGQIQSDERFPDMKALTDYVHSKGLKAGIYTSPGPLTCATCEGSYEHEAEDALRFAGWGFDFVKYDWCSYGKVVTNATLAQLQQPYRMMSDALRIQQRDLVFNFCQYGMGKVWEWGKEAGGHSWRTAGDLGGNYAGISKAIYQDGLDLYANQHLERCGGPGGWNDPDYLLFGYIMDNKGRIVPTSLSPNEQYTQMSFWALVAAPLIFSGDMTRLDKFTLNLLCNDEVIEVDQDPLGKPAGRIKKDGQTEVWARPLEDESMAVGLFNRGEAEAQVTVRWADLGLSGKQKVRDLWRQRNLGKFSDRFQASVPRHGVFLGRVSAGE